MDLSDADLLLRRDPLNLETGWERLSDGVLHVAARTDMHGCRGEMLEWWFRWRCDTQKYRDSATNQIARRTAPSSVVVSCTWGATPSGAWQ